ncbi:MAG: hypothetical protein ACHREM_12840 [Polyangiales bacterium]
MRKAMELARVHIEVWDHIPDVVARRLTVSELVAMARSLYRAMELALPDP